MLRFTLPVIVALVLSATGARADEPKARAVDLDDLKYAMTVADKRGDNVGLIREALAAFEKALTRSATMPGEAPPELGALRDAVEAAAKKGENVVAISKELGRIEKALTGREYERPKPPEPKPEPEVMPPRSGRGNPNGRAGGIVINGGGRVVIGNAGGRVVIGGNGGGFNTTSITIANNEFTITARQGAVTFLVTGTVDGSEATKITIHDGDKKTQTDDLKKVPEEHRPAVERLLKMIQRG
jgi:hypothetical protein